MFAFRLLDEFAFETRISLIFETADLRRFAVKAHNNSRKLCFLPFCFHMFVFFPIWSMSNVNVSSDVEAKIILTFNKHMFVVLCEESHLKLSCIFVVVVLIIINSSELLLLLL